MNEQTISDIIRGMQYAVNTAEDMLTEHQLRKLEKGFHKDGTPKMRFFTLPDGRRGEIPEICLTPSSALSISEVELEFRVKVEESTTKSSGRDERSSMSVSIIGTERKGLFCRKKEKPGTIRIRMKFKEKDEPEAVARAREMLDSVVR